MKARHQSGFGATVRFKNESGANSPTCRLMAAEDIFSPKREKRQPKKWVCNVLARFVHYVLEKSSSYTFGILFRLFVVV